MTARRERLVRTDGYPGMHQCRDGSLRRIFPGPRRPRDGESSYCGGCRVRFVYRTGPIRRETQAQGPKVNLHP